MKPRLYQTAPPTDWKHWAIVGGRGSGRTTAAMMWVRGFMREDPSRRALVIAQTVQQARMAAEIAGLHLPIKCLGYEGRATIIDGKPSMRYGVTQRLRGCRYNVIVVDNSDDFLMQELDNLKRALADDGRLISAGGFKAINVLRRKPKTSIVSFYVGDNLELNRFAGLLSNVEG